MSDTTTHLLLPYILAAQAQKHITHNEALRILDGLVQLSVLDRDLTAPPGSPADGDRYIVDWGATGDWAGWDLNVALFTDGAWIRLPPRTGWRAWVEDEGLLLVYDGSGWVGTTPDTLQNLDMLGVNTTADATNRLAVSAPAVLLNHDGAGHQLKVNKAALGDTASLLFQTGFSGRAEMGTAGTDDFAIKVSADGAAWNTAITIPAPTGVPDLKTGVTIGGSLAFARANILGSVAQSGGVPTGGVIERGSNANGEYVRLADGTQICTTAFTVSDAATAIGAIYMSPTYNWTFPAAYVANPSLFGVGGSTSRWVGGIPANPSIGSLRVLSAVASPTGFTANAVAIGRWF